MGTFSPVRLFIATILALFLGSLLPVHAQNPPSLENGFKLYGSYDGIGLETINLSNGNLILHIPLPLSYPQRGGKIPTQAYIVQNSKDWSVQFEGTPSEVIEYWAYTGSTWPYPLTTVYAGSYITTPLMDLRLFRTSTVISSPENGIITAAACCYSLYSWDGAQHLLAQTSGTTSIPTGFASSDNSGYQISLSGADNYGNPTTATITDRDGNTYVGTFPTTDGLPLGGECTRTTGSGLGAETTQVCQQSVAPTSVTDSNGNVYGASGLDTLGRDIPPISNSSSPSASGCVSSLPIASVSGFSYQTPGGATEMITLCYSTLTFNTNFAQSGVKEVQNSPATVAKTGTVLVTAILPDGAKYVFDWDTYGNVTSIGLPTGGSLSYTWTNVAVPPGCMNGSGPVSRGVSSRTVSDGTHSATWNYMWGTQQSNGNVTNTVTDPMGNTTVHVFSQLGFPSSSNVCPFYGLYETSTMMYQGSSTSGQLLKTVNTTYTDRLPTTVQTIVGSSVSMVQKTYDASFGDVLTEQDYDWGTGSPGAMLRQINMNYLWQSNSSYLTAGLLDLPSSIVTENGSGTRVAETDYTYDESSYLTASSITTQHVAPPLGVRGNPSTISKWLNTSGGSIVSHTNWYDTGEPYQTTDPNLNVTTFAYSPTYAGAYPTTVTNAKGQSTTNVYDLSTGLLTSTTDPNGQVFRHSYDLMFRKAQDTFPDTGQTTYCYTDLGGATCSAAAPPFDMVVTKKLTATTNITSTVLTDGLGRSVQAQLNSDPQGTDYTATTYDADGRVASVTNPYRTTGDSTYGVTQNQYDALNRTTVVTKPDGSTVSTTYTGNCTTVTDEAGKNRQSCTDGLGRLTQVTENPGGLGYVTNYQYDPLSNLTSVLQNGSRQRTFVYDSLSRLTTSSNPENGTICYGSVVSSACQQNGYDADGNVIIKTDARGITTTSSYDSLNRIMQKSYSDGTTSAFFAYDSTSTWGVTQTNTVGRLTEAWTGTSCCVTAGAEIFSYDPMGRVILGEQCTPANTACGSAAFPVNCTYDLAGDMLTATNGQGVTISYQYNGAQRVTTATSSLVNATHPGTLASGIQYAPNGAMSQITYGNSLTESSVYDPRFQPCRDNVNSSGTVFSSISSCGSTSMPTGNVLDLQYSWNLGSTDNENLVGTTVAGAQTYSRTYTYDQLNRLSSMSGTGGLCTGLSWSYDAWGNRTSQTQVSGTCFQQPTTTITAANQLSGYGYDAAGNMTSESGTTYTYDAESRLASASSGSAAYVYDAMGRRVQKTISGVWKDYIYDLQGNVVSETANGPCGDPCWITGYVYLNGRLLAEYENSTTYFVTGDNLGSSRLLTNTSGGVQDCNAFYPYGEQDTGICASSNTTTHKFTGKERDSESGLDNFGARYYASSMGRFMQPDPLLNSGRPWDPQSWNRYAYVRNNPLVSLDPTGLYDVVNNCKSGDKKCNKQFRQHAKDLREGLADLQKRVNNMRDGLEKQRLQASLTVLGKEGDSNGVNVTFGPTSKGSAGETTFDVNPDTYHVNAANITLDPQQIGSAHGYAIDAAHEGTHVEDELTGLLIVSAPRSPVPPLPDLEAFQTEYRAYQTSAWAAQALGEPSLSYHDTNGTNVVWNSSWAAADRQTLMDTGITNHVVSIPGHPEVVPHNPWPF